MRVQTLTLLNTMRYQQGRGGLKVSIAIASLWYGFWIFAAVGCAVLPRLVGAEDIETVLPGVLLFIMAYWQLTPLLTFSLGVSLDARKLTIYPVSIGTLFAVECLLRLGTGTEMMLLLAGFLGGLAAAGSPHVAELTVAFGLFTAFNVFFSAGVRNLVERLFHQRRLRELLLLVLACATLLPQLLIWSETMREIGTETTAGPARIPDVGFAFGSRGAHQRGRRPLGTLCRADRHGSHRRRVRLRPVPAGLPCHDDPLRQFLDLPRGRMAGSPG